MSSSEDTSSSEEEYSDQEVEDEEFNQAFGRHTDISSHIRKHIKRIKSNNPDYTAFVLDTSGTLYFSDQAWRLLGRYIANNTHLEFLDLDGCGITDEKMALLFSGLVESQLKDIDIRDNLLGVEGVRSMVPFLQNSPNLSVIYFIGNHNFNSECFDVLVSTLHNKGVEKLYFENCNVTNISALETYNLPNLQHLNLEGNIIGRDGCRILSSVLQRDDTSLKYLYLDNTGIDDDGAELLANSLKLNAKLKELVLSRNNITKRGHTVFLKLLNDVSSIESTYNSNHTLNALAFVHYLEKDRIVKNIDSIIQMNNLHVDSSHEAGKAKVIKYQLNIQKRKELCQLQDIKYSSEDNMLAGVEPRLLPKILAMIGEKNGQSDFYTSLLPVAPDLMSFIDRKAMIIDERARKAVQIKELTRQLAVLTAEDDQLNKRLVMIELGDSRQQSGVDGGGDSKEGDGGEKRPRMS